MSGIALLLAQLLAADTPAGARAGDDLAAVLAARRVDAKRVIDGWLAALIGPGTGHWAIFNGELKPAYEDLRVIVNRPDSMDQVDYGGCGPVSLLAILFTYFPKHMAIFTRDLLTSGTGSIGDLRLRAPAEMMAVTKADLPRGMVPVVDRAAILPEPLTWILMAVVQYAISKNEADASGLNPNSGTEPRARLAFLKSTGLITNDSFDQPVFFDLDDPKLVTKKDHPRREILLGIEGDLFDEFPLKASVPAGQHVVWLKSYLHVGSQVDMTYYTWGQSYTRSYPEQKVKDAATAFSTFTMKIDAAD